MSKRDQVLNLHNQGLEPDEIVAALSTPDDRISKGEVATKIAQCRREKPESVRPDGMTPSQWRPKPASGAPSIDWIDVVKSWNTNPDADRVSKQFGLKRAYLVERIARLRCKGVPLLPAKALDREFMAKLREAALSVLTEEQKAALAAPKKRAKVLPIKEITNVG